MDKHTEPLVAGADLDDRDPTRGFCTFPPPPRVPLLPLGHRCSGGWKGLGQAWTMLPNLQRAIDGDLLARAREKDVRHWVERRRPISADTLRKRLGIGAGRARMPVSEIRGDLVPAGNLIRAGDSGSAETHARMQS
jgi:hypothetical protein